MHTDTQSEDRRGAARFLIQQEVRYKLLGKRAAGEAGIGRTIDMSSSGILFKIEQGSVSGKLLELSISWPVKLNDNTPLKMVASGRVTRVDRGRAAVEILKHEFRIAPKSATSPKF